MINEKKTEELSNHSPISASFIHRVLGGQEIRRWNTASYNNSIIAIPCGTTYSNRIASKPTEADARKKIEGSIPRLMNHLAQYEDALRKRQDRGDYWWELRPCEYYDVFSGPKIIFPDICKDPRFCLDTEGHYLTNTAYAIGSAELYLLGILNSKLFWFLIGKISIPFGTRAGEYRYRLIYQYMEQVPIVERKEAEADPARSSLPARIESLVFAILEKKKVDPDADVAPLEAEIDGLIYSLYRLTEEEIGIVEGRRV